MSQWRGEGDTYVEIGSTVKAILIGHHTKRERERDRKTEGGRRRRARGGSTEEWWWRRVETERVV